MLQLTNVACLYETVYCTMKAQGLLTPVLFKRLDTVESGQVHELYSERKDSEKVYITYNIECVVDENPRKNPLTPMGAEEEKNVLIYFFGKQYATINSTQVLYEPQLSDHILYRSQKYEITGIERLLPNADTQAGFSITCKKFG